MRLWSILGVWMTIPNCSQRSLFICAFVCWSVEHAVSPPSYQNKKPGNSGIASCSPLPPHPPKYKKYALYRFFFQSVTSLSHNFSSLWNYNVVEFNYLSHASSKSSTSIFFSSVDFFPSVVRKNILYFIGCCCCFPLHWLHYKQGCNCLNSGWTF